MAYTLSFLSHIDGRIESFSIACDAGESMYDAAHRAALKVPIACRNGICHVCKAHLVSGEIKFGASRQSLRVDEKDPAQELMMCQSWPQGDCKFEVKNILRPGELPLKNIKCQVTTVEIIKGNVYEVELLLPAGKLPEFYAGQYLSITLPDKEAPCFYSIASRPGIRALTLHIQADPHLQSAVDIIDHLKQLSVENACVSVDLPYGKACVTQTPGQQLILMAAGTGFAQMKSIIEHMFETGFSLPISLYWGVRREEDMYERALAERWQQDYENFTFHPLVADIENIEDNAHHNQLSDAVLRDFSELGESLVFVSGSPKLVYSAMDALIDTGLQKDLFYSDVLEYAPR